MYFFLFVYYVEDPFVQRECF